MDESLRTIWWIASFPKSGSTLVRMFINAYVTKFPLDINASFQYAVIDQQPNLYQHVAAKPLDKLHPAEAVYLRPAMLMHYCQLIAPRDACFKTHNANVEIDGIPLVPPRLTKQALYLVRDPRDVAISYAHHSGISIDDTIKIICNDHHVGHRDWPIQDIILSWSSHVKSWRRAKFPVTTIRFEDIIDDKSQAFRKILPALGFRKIDEAAFQFALDQSSFENLRRLEDSNKFKEAKHDRFFRVGTYGQWKDVLTTDQIATIENSHGEAMELMGYEPSLIGV